MTSSSHSPDRSANRDHVLQQTDATPAGEGSLGKRKKKKKVLIVIDVEVWSTRTPGSQKEKKKNPKHAGYCIFVPTVSKLWVAVMQNSFFTS